MFIGNYSYYICHEWTFGMEMDIDTMTNNSPCFLAMTFYFKF